MPRPNEKWTPAQRRKFNATLKRKKAEKSERIRKEMDYTISQIKPVDPVIMKKLAEYQQKSKIAEDRHGNPIAVPNHDPVERPAHYTSGATEVADFIEDQGLGLWDGTALKYIARAGKKAQYNAAGLMSARDARLQDLKKARWYINREIDRIEKQQ